MKKYPTFLLLFMICSMAFGQENIKYYKFKTEIEATVRNQIFKTLDSLFILLTTDQLDDRFLSPDLKDLTRVLLSRIKDYETRKDSIQKNQIDKHLIRGYPINEKEYFLSFAFIQKNEDSSPTLYYIVNLIAAQTDDRIRFSSPIHHYTKDWKQSQIGSTTYYSQKEIQKNRAAIFDAKNTAIAHKLGVEKEAFHFYMCENYQEANRLLGVEFSVYENSKYRTGYGVVANTIFSIMNNEDFSHDVFHYYSGKINERKNRNWITEEGIAYLWGNAYYTDPNGEMITHQQLVEELKKYLQENPNETLYNLFENNPTIFTHLAPEVSVRSVISGILAQQVEKEKGKAGISKLINAGSQDRLKNYLKATDELIGTNQINFNSKIIDETALNGYTLLV